jgi:hypothetical protein
MPAAQPEREQRLSQLYNCTSCSGAVRSMHARGPRAVTTYKEIYSVIAPRTIGAAAPLGKVNAAVCQPSLGGPLDRAWRQERS